MRRLVGLLPGESGAPPPEGAPSWPPNVAAAAAAESAIATAAARPGRSRSTHDRAGLKTPCLGEIASRAGVATLGRGSVKGR